MNMDGRSIMTTLNMEGRSIMTSLNMDCPNWYSLHAFCSVGVFCSTKKGKMAVIRHRGRESSVLALSCEPPENYMHKKGEWCHNHSRDGY